MGVKLYDVAYKIGETTNTNYFIHNVQIPRGSKIIIKTINKYDPTKSQIQQWNINF
jgi:hypothetical protein